MALNKMDNKITFLILLHWGEKSKINGGRIVLLLGVRVGHTMKAKSIELEWRIKVWLCVKLAPNVKITNGNGNS